MDMRTPRESCALCLLLCSFMSQQPITVLGDGNIAGNNLQNVGNRNVQNFGFFLTGPPWDNGTALAQLELKAAFDALLNSQARYPAPKCHIDTRKAAQSVVMDWILGRGHWAEKGIMWISGAPGVGKSAIVQTVCETLDTEDGSNSWLTTCGFRSERKVDGCYFFGRGMGDREKVSFFPATIAFQLSQSTSYRGILKKIIENRPGVLSETFPSQFRQLLIMTSKKLWWFQHPITIVIDALDECDDVDDQFALLTLIAEAVTTSNGRMRFLIASRPEQQIHGFFQQREVSQHTYHIRLDEESFNTSRDIEVFLRVEFARIRRLKLESCPPLPNGEDWPGNNTIIIIRDDSDSQFMYPRLCIDYIDTPSFSPDRQLHTLLASRPARAFSKLDTLYHLILSRRSPDLLEEGGEALRHHHNVIMGILQIVIAWPGGPFSAIQIANILHEEIDVVQNIIRGPMRSLFKFKADDPNSPVMLCHKSLRDCLLDRDRSREFFIPADGADSLFLRLLSRRPRAGQSYSRDDLRSVLAVMAHWPGEWTIPRVAGVLDVDFRLVQNIVIGPAKLLFRVGVNGDICLSSPFLEPFLGDRNKSGRFFVTIENLDATFIQILSRPPPSEPLYSYCRDDLLDVLAALIAQNGSATESEIRRSLLGVDASVVRRVVRGPSSPLFATTSEGNIQFSTSWLRPFLQNHARSRWFSIQGRDDVDVLFFRILSRRPPSDPSLSYSQEVLMGVLRVLVAWPNQLNMAQIATVLDIAPNLAEGFIFGPANALFQEDGSNNIKLSTPTLKAFLLDAGRAGEYFIPTDKPDTLFTEILSRQPPSDPLQSYSREVLMGVLRVLILWPNQLELPQIAYWLDVAPSLVENVVFGPAKALFKLGSSEDVGFSTPSFKLFLMDAGRAGEYFIPTDKPDTLFIEILSRQPPSDPSQSYSRRVLMGVLRVVMALGDSVKVPQIAPWLDVAPSVVENVISGPAKALFKLKSIEYVEFSTPSFKLFLKDAGRAGEYFIPTNKPHTIFIKILSRQPPSDPSQSYSRRVLMGVLRVVIALENSMKVPQIAPWLDVAPSVVENVIFGPAKALFKLDSSRNVGFSTWLFKLFLMDAGRAGEYFIPTDEPDTLFIEILSRQPPSDPSQSYSRGVLMGVLRVVMALENRVKVVQIAPWLDVVPSVVENVVFGPAKALFELDDIGHVGFSTWSFTAFLMDAGRAGEYFIPTDEPDTLFIEILSRQPPSDPSQSYSRGVLMGVLRVVMALGVWEKIPQIAPWLDVAPSAVENVIFGPAKALFELGDIGHVGFSTWSFTAFLKDAGRAGEYFIPTDEPDTLFIEILSRQPPSDPLQSYSREVLMGVLRVLILWPNQLELPQIASWLDVAPSLVENVIFGPAKALFKLGSIEDVGFSTWSFTAFLMDAGRAGEYFIPTDKPDTLFTEILSRQPPSDPLQSYSREVLMGVLRVLILWPNWLKVPQIASRLDVAPSLVENVIFGPAKALFKLGSIEDVGFSTPSFKLFLKDAGRAGEYFIPTDKPETVST